MINTIKWWFGERDGDLQIGLTSDLPIPADNYGVLSSENGAFPGIAQASLYHCFDDILCLSIRISRKNYHSEIEQFLYWIAPNSKTEGFVGYTKTGVRDDPNLIYFFDGKAFLIEVDSQKQTEITADSFRSP